MDQSKFIDEGSNAVNYGADGCVSIHFFTPTRCVAAAHVGLDQGTWNRYTLEGCEKAEVEARASRQRVTKVIIKAPYRSAAMITHNFIRSKFPRAYISP